MHFPGSKARWALASLTSMALLLAFVAPIVSHPGFDGSRTDDPAIFPAPQSVKWSGRDVPIDGRVALVTPGRADPATTEALRATIEAAGGTIVGDSEADHPTARIVVGSVGDVGTASIPASARVPKDAEGYAVATDTVDGLPTVAIVGRDARGTFYGAQTLRQMVSDGRVRGGELRDWPLMRIRGAVEGFYGIPWSHRARLDALAFFGRHKLNAYVYAPKDDPYLRARWRDPYPRDRLAELAELADRGEYGHVDFVVALSPGDDVCYGSQDDYAAAIAKMDQLRGIGVRSFSLAMDDIDEDLACPGDSEAFPDGSSDSPLAEAQAHFANRIQREYVQTHGLDDLLITPTSYHGTDDEPYKAALGERLDSNIRVQWTGTGVVSETITARDAQAAADAYGTERLVVWDNFPVNDGDLERLFMAPPTGRDPDLHRYVDGATSNPMVEAYASMPTLAAYGDYAWNGPAYDPGSSYEAGLREVARIEAKDMPILLAFVDVTRSWAYGGPKGSTGLKADIDAFETALRADDDAAVDRAATELKARLDLIGSIESLRESMAPGLWGDIQPWAKKVARCARKARHAVDVRLALRRDDRQTAARKLADMNVGHDVANVDTLTSDLRIARGAVEPTAGDGLFEAFVESAYGAWTEEHGPLSSVRGDLVPVASVDSSMPESEGHSTAMAADGDDATFYESDEAPVSGSNVTLDLGSVRDIDEIAVEQGGESDADEDSDESSNDVSEDYFHYAFLETSEDGTRWTRVGTHTLRSNIAQRVPTGTRARYVRLGAAIPNPNDQPVRLREFSVRAPARGLSATGRVDDGGSLTGMADGDPSTQASVSSGSPTILTRDFPAPVAGPATIVLVGRGLGGELEIRDATGKWRSVGRVSDRSFHEEIEVEGSFVAMRLVRTGKDDGTKLIEFGYRTNG